MTLSRVLRLSTLVLLASAMAFAQQSTGSISGVVTDAAGAPVPGVKIEAKHNATGAVLQTVSTGAGRYAFPSLPLGFYTVTYEKTGFKKLNRTNLEMRVAQRQDLDVVLEIGDVMQSVEVVAEAPLLETSTPMRG